MILIWLIVKRLLIVEFLGDVIRNMMSLFYSFIDCYEKKNGWMSLFLFLVIIYVILNVFVCIVLNCFFGVIVYIL